MPTKRNRKTKRGGTWPFNSPTEDPEIDKIVDKIIECVKDGKAIDPTMFSGKDPKKINLALTKKIANFHPDIKVRYNRIINYLDTSFDLNHLRSFNPGPTVYKEANTILGYIYPEIGSKKIIELLTESPNLEKLLEILQKQTSEEQYKNLQPSFTQARQFQDAKRHEAYVKSWY